MKTRSWPSPGKHNTVLEKECKLIPHLAKKKKPRRLQDAPETVCLQLYRLISYNQSDPWLPPKHLMKWSDKVFLLAPCTTWKHLKEVDLHRGLGTRYWVCYWGFVLKPRTDYETKGPEPLTHKKDHQPTIQDRDTEAQSHFQLLPRPLAFHVPLYPSGHFFFFFLVVFFVFSLHLFQRCFLEILILWVSGPLPSSSIQ